jgi:hypothetical protein
MKISYLKIIPMKKLLTTVAMALITVSVSAHETKPGGKKAACCAKKDGKKTACATGDKAKGKDGEAANSCCSKKA